MQKSGLKRVVREATLGDCLSCYWPAGTPAVELHSQKILTDTVCLDQEDGNGQVVLAPSMSIKCPCKNLLSPWTPAGEIRSYRGYTSPIVKNQCFLDFVHIATSKCLSQSRELVHRHFHVKVPSMLANRSQSRAGLTWNLLKFLGDPAGGNAHLLVENGKNAGYLVTGPLLRLLDRSNGGFKDLRLRLESSLQS
jgi:hypothetical protein